MSFWLHAEEVADDQIGDTLDAFGFDLFDDYGRFTIDLDFGDDVFDGTPLWLEIWVNGAPLSPRQPIMLTPYAVRARRQLRQRDSTQESRERDQRQL